MAPTYQFGGGWETGHVAGAPNFVPDTGASPSAIETIQVHTGSYALLQNGGGTPGNGYVDLTSLSASELWFGLWMTPHDTQAQVERARVRFLLSTGERHEVRLQTDGAWDTYINGVKQENGTIMAGDVYQNLQIHLLINNVGTFELKVDGVVDTTFSGDTQPGAAATIDRMEFYALNSDWIVDDYVVATVDYPGDVRFDAILPTGDSSVQWARSAGANNFETVDERPPSDSCGDWVGSGKSPVFVTQLARLRKDEAAAHQAELIMDDGTESIGSPFDLTTSFVYYNRMLDNKPSGGEWTETAVDALIVGQRAQIV
jgi:hypothetical protein